MMDSERPFQLVLRVTLRGYGKEQHKQRLLEKVVKELELQFNDVGVVMEIPSLVLSSENRISWRGQ